jgi:hypothetical protein
MAKNITSQELGNLVQQILNNPESLGEDMSGEAYSRFMTDMAKVVCDHFGGEVHNPAYMHDGMYYMIGIHSNDCLPAGGGVWANLDPEGELEGSEPEEDGEGESNRG